MVSLTDSQLAAIMNAARMLPVEKRDTFLQRLPPCSHYAAAVASPMAMLTTSRIWRWLVLCRRPIARRKI